MWETDEECFGEIRVYEALIPHVPTEKHSIGGGPLVYKGDLSTLHKIKADGLCPDTDYFYEVISKKGDSVVLSDQFSFRTAPCDRGAISFVLVAEEGGVGKASLDFSPRIQELIRRERPDFIQSVGDILSDGREQEDWNTYFFTPFRGLISSVPFYPCVGNHEVGSNAVPDGKIEVYYSNYKRYFDFPRNYSYDYGCAHFCVLDTPSLFERIDTSKSDKYIPRLKENIESSEAYLFLEKDLASSDAAWKFVVFHFPLYTSSIYDVRELEILAPLFEKYNVDIVFNSHAIVYERSHPVKEGMINKNGVRYILVGGHGDLDRWIRDKSNRLSAKLSARPCYVRVALTPWSLELQAIDHAGILFDTLSLEKG